MTLDDFVTPELGRAGFRLSVRVAFALVAAGSARAQRVTGVVSETGNSVAISGAVVSTLDSAGHVISRTISDTRGHYLIAWRQNAAQLRVVHIGYRPGSTSLRPITADTSFDFILDRVPVQLDSVRVSSDPTCGGSETGQRARLLWEEARSALLATIVARESKPAQVSNLTYERRFGARDDRITHQRSTVEKRTSGRPFLSARSADVLATRGYMLHGTVEDSYFAPDADVLFDESFAAAHCFGVQIGADEHRDQIGLAFAPPERAQQNAIVDVRGVLWLDRKGPTLSRLEYRYTGVNAIAAQTGAGGTMHFRAMPNGVAFVDEWVISLPVVQQVVGRTVSGDTIFRPVLVERTEGGGIVLDAAWPDGARWVTRHAGTIRGRVVERETSAPAKGVIVGVTGVATALTDSDGRFNFAPLPAGRYAIQLTDSVFGEFVRPRTAGRDAALNAGDTVELQFDIASRASVVGSLCGGQKNPDVVLLGRMSDGGSAVPKGLRVQSGERRLSTDVDDAGRFHACGIARDRPILLRAVIGNVTLADTVLAAGGDIVRSVGWNVGAGLFTTVQLGDGSALTGRVVRDNDGGAVADAEVWIVPGDVRGRTDSSGQFRLYGLNAGPQFVQIRRIGYGLKRDTVTLHRGEASSRQFSLAAQVALLDTVRTKSDAVKYMSPALKGFESRRAEGFGHFISEAELRKNDNASLASILMRVPGLILVSYGGARFAGTTRGHQTAYAVPLDKQSPKGCWVDVFIDGISMYGGPPLAAPDMSRMSVGDYAGVEYYSGTGTLPLQFNSPRQTGCGILLLWTRER